ncbi:MAG: hypothetical protein L0177_16560 [Chloroflexi bacterium]|nr:hypothetical protein [Chloroflexota bacterium]
MTIELLVNALARGALGLISAIVLSFFIWWLTWVSFNTSDLSLALFFLVQASIVGGAAAVPTVFAWWNTQSSRRIHLALVVLTFGTAVASAWLVNEIRGVETRYALFRGVLSVPVFSLSHMLVSMILGAALGANAVAAALYLYRALRHREY